MGSGPGGPYITYEGGAMYVVRCPLCGRFVSPDETTRHSEMTGAAKEPNATCKRCGRVEMPFLGYFEEEEW